MLTRAANAHTVVQAAKVLLMDDNIVSLIHGIEQGRIIFDNLSKTIAYTVTHLVPEVSNACLCAKFRCVCRA